MKWGVKDRDTFFHALVAVLRPVFGVLDVLLNDAYLGLFDIVRIPGSNGYTSSIVPLMEAFSMYNVKTQYQYREDMKKAYDNVLLDIINPIWDKVEDILNAPLETLFEMLPNLALFIGNNGLCLGAVYRHVPDLYGKSSPYQPVFGFLYRYLRNPAQKLRRRRGLFRRVKRNLIVFLPDCFCFILEKCLLFS